MGAERKRVKRWLRDRYGEPKRQRTKPKLSRKLPWKPIVVAFVAIVVVAAVIALKPWEGKPGGEGQQPTAGYRLFSRSTYLMLENTEDNSPIENVLIYAPFPDEFENLHFRGYWFGTDNYGSIITQNGDVLENTLVEREPPSFTIEDTVAGKRVAVRMKSMYVGDIVSVTWRFWAPENTSLYDTPKENRCKIYVGYDPTKTINLKFDIGLYDVENYPQTDLSNLGTLWWRWWRYVDSSGWLDILSENVFFGL